jgi:hypothetical protein
MTGSKRMNHWTSGTVCECNEIAGSAQINIIQRKKKTITEAVQKNKTISEPFKKITLIKGKNPSHNLF